MQTLTVNTRSLSISIVSDSGVDGRKEQNRSRSCYYFTKLFQVSVGTVYYSHREEEPVRLEDTLIDPQSI